MNTDQGPGLFDNLDEKEAGKEEFNTGDARILSFDLETKYSADDVGGWNNIHQMGMSLGVIYDSLDKEFHVYLEKDAETLIKKLESADLVVGYNVIRFDYTVLRAYGTISFSKLNTFDMLTDITDRLGFRLKLDTLVRSTLGKKKSADGMKALQWYKEGRMDLIEEYCKVDVEVTRDLFIFGVQNQYLLYESKGEQIKLPVDWNIEQLLGSNF